MITTGCQTYNQINARLGCAPIEIFAIIRVDLDASSDLYTTLGYVAIAIENDDDFNHYDISDYFDCITKN